MDSHGGWLASPLDLIRFLNHVYSTAQTTAILKPDTVSTMTTPSLVNPGYARGWAITGLNRWHTGTLPGTSAIMVQTPNGLCWAALANSRDYRSRSVAGLDEAVWNMVRKVKAWEAPTSRICTHENGRCSVSGMKP
jgi:Beta-lactamase